MIPARPVPRAGSDWRRALREAWRDPRALLAHLGHDPDSFALDHADSFPFLVTRAFAARMRPGDRDDPLLRQVLPLADERHAPPGFGADPVGDLAARAGAGLLHKYHGRALFITTGACPIHCRYCFRREFDYAGEQLTTARLQEAVDMLSAQPEIDEIILSGGDPLMLTTERLTRITDALRALPQIRRLRLHSRVPVVLPERINSRLIAWLEHLPWPVVIVIHANHANEFDASVVAALQQLRRAGADVLNQAVLLAGVNDDEVVLEKLMRASHEAGALPYYLHLLDRVRGSAHFEVSEARARMLMVHLRHRLPGYLVPRLVREQAGAGAKQVVAA
ncbi:MAG: EF-P beta-lysylation protein EpmB [Wenzhouxiangellaceae bacterium]|nr:EF-P beta-lysylation protein EpmB [Wenzhouxiangellaceae bacterium]